MKEYEVYNDLKVPKGSRIILRLDGRNFHSLSKNLNLKRPYDDEFVKSMVSTSRDIFKEFSPLFIYTFSDEINVLLSEIPFSGRIEKLNSIFPSLVSSSLTIHLNNCFSSYSFNSYNDEDVENNLISFDSRIVPISTDEDIVKYFKWRQDESWRNCINSYGYWTLRENFSAKETTKKLKGLKASDIHQLLFENGINLNNTLTYEKRGIAVYKDRKKVVGFNPKVKEEECSYRNVLFVNKELPIFDNDFFRKLDII